jgi:hypothetical protein
MLYKGFYSTRVRLSNYHGPIFAITFPYESSPHPPIDVYLSSNQQEWLDRNGRPIHYHPGKPMTVQTWYDQSGNRHHASMDQSALQPYVNMEMDRAGGGMVFLHGRHFLLPDETIPMNNLDYSIVAHHGHIWNPMGAIVGSGQYGNLRETNCLRRHGTGYCHYWWGNDAQVYNIYKPNSVIACCYHGSLQERSIWINGKYRYCQPSEDTRHGAPSNNTIGIALPNEGMDGELFTLIITEHCLDATELSNLSSFMKM